MTLYKQRIRASTAFDIGLEPKQAENNEPVNYTFGDDVQDSLKFDINNYVDNDFINDFDDINFINKSSSYFINDEDETGEESEDSQYNDNEDVGSINSDESEYSSMHHVEDEDLENIG